MSDLGTVPRIFVFVELGDDRRGMYVQSLDLHYSNRNCENSTRALGGPRTLVSKSHNKARTNKQYWLVSGI